MMLPSLLQVQAKGLGDLHVDTSQGDSLGQKDSCEEVLAYSPPLSALQGPKGAADPLPTHPTMEATPALLAGRGGAAGLGKWAGQGKRVLS